VVFHADTVGKTPVKRIQYSDNEQRVDYALYQGGGAQAEFIYMETYYFMLVAFEFPYIIRDKVEAWNFLKGRPKEWGEAIQLRTKLGWIFYKPFRVTRTGQQCFGMSGEWYPHPNDAQQRDTRIMFGYYCAPKGQALSDRQLMNLVTNIGIRGVTERAIGHADRVHNFYGDVEAHFGGDRSGVQAMKTAQQGSRTELAGIDEFPFRYAEYFRDGDAAKDD